MSLGEVGTVIVFNQAKGELPFDSVSGTAMLGASIRTLEGMSDSGLSPKTVTVYAFCCFLCLDA